MKQVNKLGIFFLTTITILGINHRDILSEEIEINSHLIHQQILTVDSHIDWPIKQIITPNFDPTIRHQYGEKNSGQWDLVRMEEGKLDVAFMSIYTKQKERTEAGHLEAKEKALKMINLTKQMIKNNSGQVELALNPEDAYRLEKKGKKAIFLGMENGYPLGTNIDNLDFFFQQGIRYITLTHSLNNEIGDSSTDTKQEWQGLSPFGKEVVKKMNELGIMIDISHVHDDTFWDVIKLTKAPIIASHSSVRSIQDHPRNLSDDMLKAIAKNGGVIQICLLDDYIKELEQNQERIKAMEELEDQRQAFIRGKLNPDEVQELFANLTKVNQQYPKNKPTIADAVDHIDYVVQTIGINHVGIGSDFDGGGGLKGLEDVSQIAKITQELLNRNYSLAQIEKIWGGNLMRVFAEVQAKAN